MTRVLVVTGIDLEARALARHLALAPVAGSAFPHFAGGVLEILCGGLRAAYLDARHAGRAAPRYALVISAGTCAALAPDLHAGALVVPEAVVGPDGDRRAAAAVAGLEARGVLLTVDRALATPGAKSRLWLAHSAATADMESSVILDWAAARGVPAAVVRGVSDVAARGVPPDLAAVVADDGRVRRLRAVTAVLARPRAAADAMALRAGTASGLRSVARALGTLARALA